MRGPSAGLWPLLGSSKGLSSFPLWPVVEDCGSASACSYALQLLVTSYYPDNALLVTTYWLLVTSY